MADKLWSHRGETSLFLDKPFDVTPPTDARRSAAPAYSRALLNAIKGEALPRSVSKQDLRDALTRALNAKKISPEHIPPIIRHLKLDDLPVLPPRAPAPNPAKIRDIMAKEAAKVPKPQFTPDEKHYETIGQWAYDPTENHVFFDGQYLDAHDYVACALGVLIEQYPTPHNLADLIDEVQQKGHDYLPSMNAVLGNLKKAANTASNKTQSVIQNTEDGMTQCFLGIPLSDIPEDILETMDLVKDPSGRITISKLQKSMWVDGIPYQKNVGATQRFEAMSMLFNAPNTYIDMEEFRRHVDFKSFKSFENALNRLLTNIGVTERIYTDYRKTPYKTLAGLAYCSSLSDWEAAVRQKHNIKPCGARPSGKQGEAFEPQFL